MLVDRDNLAQETRSWLLIVQRTLYNDRPNLAETCSIDLYPMIRTRHGIVIEDREIDFESIRASGPGGQNVNKVATAVRLRYDVRGSASLPLDVRVRLIRLAGKRIAEDGFLMIHARRFRTQESNRKDAIERLVELIDRACERPKPRRATKPTTGSKERRLDAKRRRGETKDRRRPRGESDD
jgi:ribosome-associated protein